METGRRTSRLGSLTRRLSSGNGVPPILIVALVAVTLTLALYSSTLSLPLYSDDLLQVPWVSSTPPLDFWRTVGPYRDYRPLHFTLWRLLTLLTGDLRPALLHGLNLVAHALCGTLVGLLAARGAKRPRLAGALAAAFFTAFPFAFDAVPWAIAFSYPLTVALALGALLAYLHARERNALGYHALAVALTLLAGFAHEGGVVAGGLVLLAELTFCRDAGRRASRWPLAHLTGSAIPLLCAALARPQGTALHGLTWPDLGYSAAFALQALTFPAAPLGGLLSRSGLNPALAVAVVGLPALVALSWAARKAPGPRRLLLALGWCTLWCLPPLLTLRLDWLRDAPRAFYPMAAGVALLWTNLGLVSWKRIPPALVAAATALVCLAPGGWFVLGRVALQDQAGTLLWQVVDAAQTDPPLLIVNLPSRVTPPGRFYPLGHEGVIPLPSEVGADDLVAAHSGVAGAAFERSWGPVLAPLPYAVRLLGAPLAPADVRAAGRVTLVSYRSDGVELREAGSISSAEAATPPLARFGQSIALLSATCSRAGATRVTLSTRWRAREPAAGSPTLFAHLMGPEGTLLAQADGDPLLGLYPLPLWQPGEEILDLRTFEGVPPGPTTAAFGIWDPAAGLRWDAVGSDGTPLPENAFTCQCDPP